MPSSSSRLGLLSWPGMSSKLGLCCWMQSQCSQRSQTCLAYAAGSQQKAASAARWHRLQHTSHIQHTCLAHLSATSVHRPCKWVYLTGSAHLDSGLQRRTDDDLHGSRPGTDGKHQLCNNDRPTTAVTDYAKWEAQLQEQTAVHLSFSRDTCFAATCAAMPSQHNKPSTPHQPGCLV